MQYATGYYDGYYDYFMNLDLDEYLDEAAMEEVNVMSLDNDNATTSLNPFKVVVDTGATESVCGVTSMARLLDSMDHPEYSVVLHDRPLFRFGNGLSQQATSRLDVHTPAFGLLSFYLLDGDAEMTPPLLGGRELWNRQAIVAYCGEYLAHQKEDQTWWTNKLLRLRGRPYTAFVYSE